MSFVLLFDSQRVSFVVVVVSCFILFTATARCFCSFLARLAAVFREVDDNNEETRQKCQVLFLDFHIPIPLRSRGSTARHSEQKYFCCFFCWRVESWEKNSPWDEITKFCALETIKLSGALVWGEQQWSKIFVIMNWIKKSRESSPCELTEKCCARDIKLRTKEDAAITECAWKWEGICIEKSEIRNFCSRDIDDTERAQPRHCELLLICLRVKWWEKINISKLFFSPLTLTIFSHRQLRLLIRIYRCPDGNAKLIFEWKISKLIFFFINFIIAVDLWFNPMITPEPQRWRWRRRRSCTWINFHLISLCRRVYLSHPLSSPITHEFLLFTYTQTVHTMRRKKLRWNFVLMRASEGEEKKSRKNRIKIISQPNKICWISSSHKFRYFSISSCLVIDPVIRSCSLAFTHSCE